MSPKITEKVLENREASRRENLDVYAPLLTAPEGIPERDHQFIIMVSIGGDAIETAGRKVGLAKSQSWEIARKYRAQITALRAQLKTVQGALARHSAAMLSVTINRAVQRIMSDAVSGSKASPSGEKLARIVSAYARALESLTRATQTTTEKPDESHTITAEVVESARRKLSNIKEAS